MIIGMSLTHNDYSKDWLLDWLLINSKYVQLWVIVDDCSDDDTYNFIKRTKEQFKLPIILYQTNKSTFIENENAIREFLWNKIREVAKDGDWIVNLDSDEVICPEFGDKIKKFLNLKNLLSFKKIEMWNRTHYNIAYMWSNYFTRMFPYINVEWGRHGSGFHTSCIPKEIENKFIRIPANIRIKHLGYSTEKLRKEKYDFMMEMKQQKKDGIDYYNLQTINKNPILKKYKDEYELPSLTIFIFCANLYRLPVETIQNFLLDSSYSKDKLRVIFIISFCDKALIEEAKWLKDSNPNYEYYIVTFKDENFFSILHNKYLILRNFVPNLVNSYDYLMLVNGETSLTSERVYHNMLIEKDVIKDKNIVTLSSNFPISKITTDQDIISYCKNNKILIWNSSFNEPFPIINENDMEGYFTSTTS